MSVRHSLISHNVTLDGKPAKISGAMQDFATIFDLDDLARSVEFAWETVRRIVINKRGAFQS